MLKRKNDLPDELARLKRNFVLSSLESDREYAEEILEVCKEYLGAVKDQIGRVKKVDWFYEVYLRRDPWGSKGIEFRTGVRKLPIVSEILEPGLWSNTYRAKDEHPYVEVLDAKLWKGKDRGLAFKEAAELAKQYGARIVKEGFWK